jgi:hypothetical protein
MDEYVGYVLSHFGSEALNSRKILQLGEEYDIRPGKKLDILWMLDGWGEEWCPCTIVRAYPGFYPMKDSYGNTVRLRQYEVRYEQMVRYRTSYFKNGEIRVVVFLDEVRVFDIANQQCLSWFDPENEAPPPSLREGGGAYRSEPTHDLYETHQRMLKKKNPNASLYFRS